MNLLLQSVFRKNEDRPPVWMMRQAGRYHSHYQKLRKEHSFEDLCKNPDLATEVTMGPINDFGFDAAILFSDLLFPLEALGMNLRYDPGPKFDRHLENKEDFANLLDLSPKSDSNHPISFQFSAMKKIRQALPTHKGLIGFVGGPFTLYLYSRFGSHDCSPEEVESDLESENFDVFWKKLKTLLLSNIQGQLQSGADVIAIFDTSAGLLSPKVYRSRIVPVLGEIFKATKSLFPEKGVLYYSRGTSFAHWDALQGLSLDALGVDWREDLNEVLKRYHRQWAIQGNANPEWLTLSASEFQNTISKYFETVIAKSSSFLRGWICGLGHGVTPKALETNVRAFVEIQKRMFSK